MSIGKGNGMSVWSEFMREREIIVSKYFFLVTLALLWALKVDE